MASIILPNGSSSGRIILPSIPLMSSPVGEWLAEPYEFDVRPFVKDYSKLTENDFFLLITGAIISTGGWVDTECDDNSSISYDPNTGIVKFMPTRVETGTGHIIVSAELHLLNKGNRKLVKVYESTTRPSWGYEWAPQYVDVDISNIVSKYQTLSPHNFFYVPTHYWWTTSGWNTYEGPLYNSHTKTDLYDPETGIYKLQIGYARPDRQDYYFMWNSIGSLYVMV